jgi:hypothetical protein
MKFVKSVAVALLIAPAIAAAQAATAPAPAPAPADTLAKTPGAKKWEIRLGGFMVNGERSAVFNNTVSTSTGSLKGVEVLLRAPGIGIQVRSSESAFGNPPDVINADASLILGPPAFSIFLGGAKRAITSSIGTNVFTFARVGLQMTFGIGGTGLRAQFGGWGYAAGPDDKDRMDPGAEGEASILYSPPRIPVFVQVGYRNEIFKSKTSSTATPEEVRGLRLGAGIQFGGK